MARDERLRLQDWVECEVCAEARQWWGYDGDPSDCAACDGEGGRSAYPDPVWVDGDPNVVAQPATRTVGIFIQDTEDHFLTNPATAREIARRILRAADMAEGASAAPPWWFVWITDYPDEGSALVQAATAAEAARASGLLDEGTEGAEFEDLTIERATLDAVARRALALDGEGASAAPEVDHGH